MECLSWSSKIIYIFVRSGNVKLISSASAERLSKKAGAQRISPDALSELIRVLEEYAERIAERAPKYARYAKRLTIKREDIELSASE